MLKKIHQSTPVIDAAYFVVTEQCNLRCKYCYETHGDKRMTKEVAKAGLEFLFRNSTSSGHPIEATFFGGEPTLEPDLIEYAMDYGYELSEKYRKTINFGFVTNCVTLPKKVHDSILKYGKDNYISVQLSIDGPEMIQDQYRVFADGKGSWSQVTKTLDKWVKLYEQLDGNGILSIHGCFNKQTLPYLYDSYIYFREERNFPKLWNIPVSEEKWMPEDIEIYKEQLTKIKDYIVNRAEKEGNFEEIEHYSPLNRCFSEPSERSKPCGAGMNFVSITPEGTLSPCHQMHFNMDNASIGDVWQGVDQDKRRLFVEYTEDDFPCAEKECPNTSCYRCLAHNFDSRNNMFAIHSQAFCRMMDVDAELLKELREYIRSKR